MKHPKYLHFQCFLFLHSSSFYIKHSLFKLCSSLLIPSNPIPVVFLHSGLLNKFWSRGPQRQPSGSRFSLRKRDVKSWNNGWISMDTPQKFNIDTKNGHIQKEPPFLKIIILGPSMLVFGGVSKMTCHLKWRHGIIAKL